MALTQDEKKKTKLQWILAGVSGLLLGAAYPPLPLFFFMFAAFVPLLYVLQERETLSGMCRISYFSFLIFSIISLYWVGSWTPEADPFLKISGIALILFNPLVFLIPVVLYYYAVRVFGREKALYILPLLWVFFEYTYTLTELRFPWLTLANSQPYFHYYIQIADIIGAFGISLLIMYTNIFAYKLVMHYINRKKIEVRFASIIALLIIIPVIYGLIRTGSFEMPGEKINAGIVQPDINPWKKWETGNLSEQIDHYLHNSNNAVKSGAEILVWPETALPVYLLSGAYDSYAARIKGYSVNNNIPIISGMPDATFFRKKDSLPVDVKYLESGTPYVSYNSVIAVQPGTKEIQKYQKVKLVPFGEKVPFVETIPILGDLIKWNVGISSWNVGKSAKNLNIINNGIFKEYAGDTLKVGGVICIESIYPVFVSKFVKQGADVLAVVTNDSWYGNSSGPYQHKEISVLRAIENRRTVLRSANGGVSAIIDPLGNTLVHTNMFETDVITGKAPLNNEITFFTEYPNLIPYLSTAAALIIILLFIYLKISESLKKRNKSI